MKLLASKRAVHVEVCLKQLTGRLEQVQAVLEEPLKDLLGRKQLPFNDSIKFQKEELENEVLYNVESVLMECESKQEGELSSPEDAEYFVFHFYWPQRRAMELEMFDTEGGSGGGDDDSNSVPSSNHWILPSQSFEGLWQHLIYDKGLKEKLLRFAVSALLFSQHNVNHNIISCNRLILLHGPPGTGKTSLCKALAQKLSIRCRSVFKHTHLIEINSHSLFSKWFSESGKLVMRLFSKIKEIIADRHNLVCVLIDEVESLAYARDCMSGQEPKDAMRVVNALLTQLDSIKEHPNVLILATSNLADTIDLAFLDRADIKQYIGLPNELAIRKIYESMLTELMRVGLLESCDSFQTEDKHEGSLKELAKRSKGLSGRTLRKLPFLAHATYCFNMEFDCSQKIIMANFLDALLEALEKYHQDQQLMKSNKNV
ncbi:pachytene checkpoint protein 2 homolog [Lucilia sericata]|uniref:pachytene checkpoint protein 2 homolog n=1 Tax=Lucilia sericata TaxID=13632 RepID=UPI0018A8343A|nr:pachytene checkpoint protein 2 homolog [Lucilia sericata]